MNSVYRSRSLMEYGKLLLYNALVPFAMVGVANDYGKRNPKNPLKRFFMGMTCGGVEAAKLYGYYKLIMG